MSKPRPPKELSNIAKAEWTRIVDDVDQAGNLDTCDRSALILYVNLYETWHNATADIRKNGEVYKQPNGWLGHNPYLSIAQKSSAAMVRLLVQFGLTPKARGNIKAEPDAGGQADDIIAKLKG